MSTLKTNAIQTVAGKPILNSTGSILQVVHTAKSESEIVTSVSTPSGWYLDVPGLSAIITPSSVNNRILIMTNMYVGASTAAPGAPGYQQHFRIKRNENPIYFSPVFEGTRPRSAGRISMYEATDTTSLQYKMSQLSGVHYDYPQSTLPLVYQIELGGYSNNPVVYLNRSQAFQDIANNYDSVPTSSLTLMEISA